MDPIVLFLIKYNYIGIIHLNHKGTSTGIFYKSALNEK